MQNRKQFLQFVACGLAGGLASAAAAQPIMINGSGATLLEALFNAPAATNDFIDVNNNANPGVEQLAPTGATPGSGDFWAATYRVVGSGNGFAELRDWGIGTFATAMDGDPANGTLNCSFSDSSIFNRTEFCIAGIGQPSANTLNPGATPYRADSNFILSSSTTAPEGIQIDFAALDVPVSWASVVDGSGRFNNVPGDVGYGNNMRLAVNKDGTGASQDNRLESLMGLNGNINTNTANPNANTVFDTPITLTPVAAITNFGVGLEEIRMSDLRHLNATGRRDNGENLMCVTRDSGSGTRNAFMNGICLDPSWGVGENIGDRTVSSSNDLLGPNFQPSNKGGSSRMEATVRNHRLATGHTGAERGESSGWLINEELELFGVISDIKEDPNNPGVFGTQPARPTLENILDGNINGYNIVGAGGIATVGDPRALPASGSFPGIAGTFNYAGDDNGNPETRNRMAGAYVNNITRSIENFVAVPLDPANLGSPGEFLASQFLLVASSEVTPTTNPPAGAPCIPLIPNPAFNPGLNQQLANGTIFNVLSIPEYASFNQNSAGPVPTRTGGVTYSDGVANGANYIDEAGRTVFYGDMLTMRNKIAGDFNNDGARSPDDVADMLAAYAERNGGANWNSPGPNADDTVIEILGDFTGDGNFDASDIRYWADGLHLVNDLLDRVAGFTAVDDAFGGNFFGTMLATGASYENGDSRGDISNPLGNHTRGFVPGYGAGGFDGDPMTDDWSGADGVVDDHDIDRVYAQFKQNAVVTDGEATWMDTLEAVSFDLSADINGDLVVDQADVVELVTGILETSLGDVNLDGVCDGTDLMIAQGNLGNAGGWADGDVDGDGTVTNADLGIIQTCGCYADCTGEGTLDIFDFICFQDAFVQSLPYGDCTGNGVYDIFDFICFQDAFVVGCP